MRQIFGLLTSHARDSLLLIGALIICLLITIILYVFFKRNPNIKYIPSLVFLAIGIFNLIVGLSEMLEPSGLEKLSYAFIFGTSGLVTSCIAGILGVIDSRKKNKRAKD